MNGIILFADNRIFDDGNENRLFHLFLKDPEFSVIPIASLECLESTIKSASTFRACVIDWDFENPVTTDEDFDGVVLPQRTPFSILMNYSLYSLIYIYSEKEIPDKDKEQLIEIFNDKIQFKTKLSNVESEYLTIKNDIKAFEEKHRHMSIPFIWSQSINQSAQAIFTELETASSYWIKEIRDTANSDGSDATSEVIDVFNNLLNEDLIQNKTLRDSLDSVGADDNETEEESTAKLYRRIYYSSISDSSPIMTGDIFKFDDEKYAILITPECDLAEKHKKNEDVYYDFLMIGKSSSLEYQKKKQKTFTKDATTKKIFNNGVISQHVLVSFPFEDSLYNQIGVVDFKTAFRTVTKMINNRSIQNYRTKYKLNAPYIHQLRQRFVSFFGRFGVPAIPDSLRVFNLKEME